MLWGSLQMFALLTGNRTWFEWIARAQMFFSIRPLRPDRISGLTYEPHWFAEQMIVLLLPWVLGAILCGYSVWRIRRIPIEWLLFTWLVILLPFSYSRSGTVSLVSICLLGLLLWGIQHWHLRRPNFVLKAILVLSMVLLSLAAIGSKNAFFARIWRYWLSPSADLSTAVATASEQDSPIEIYLSYLGLDARIMYARAAYRAYLEHPWLGIGLGNYAFYVEQYLPDQPIAYVPEVLRMITPERDRLRLVTPKNLYVRLLGESGILGTIAFMTFGLTLFRYSTLSWISRRPSAKYWGTASVLADAELMVIIHAVLTELGIQDFMIHINNRKLLNAITGSAGIAPAQQAVFLRSLDKQDKIGQEGVRAELAEKGFSVHAVNKVFEIFNALDGLERHQDKLARIGSVIQGNAEGEAGCAELVLIREALAAQGIPDSNYRFDLSLARGLDYYTGPVFETRVISPKIGSITGGGRYDNLIGLFTNSSVPATGSSFGLERLVTVLEEMQRVDTPDSATQVLVTLFDMSLRNETLRLAHTLRTAALKTEIYFEAEKLKKQLSYAAQKGIVLVVILGPDEVRTDTAVLRNMRSSSQEVVPQRDLIQRIKGLLAVSS